MRGHRALHRWTGLVFGLLLVASRSQADVTAPSTIALAIPGGAFATLSPANGYFTDGPPNLIASGSTFPTIVDVPQFNPASGTLTGVNLQLAATQADGSAEFFAIMGPPTLTSIRFDRAVVLSGPAGLSLSASFSTSSSNIPAGSLFSAGLPAPLVTSSQTFNDPAIVAAFVGTGDVPLSAVRSLNVFPSPASVVHARLTSTGSAAGELTVTYAFAPAGVPEPPSVCLLGVALGLAWTAARRGPQGQRP